MSTPVKKQATKIAKKAIQAADAQAKATIQNELQFVQRFDESRAIGETEGRDALTNLRRLKGEKLPQGDEVVIARHLYDELPLLKRHLRAKGIGLGEFCSRYQITDASESSKELHRLILAPGKNPADVRLRRAAGKYRILIEAISKVTNESVSYLADRVLLGTTLHPAKQMGNMSESEKVQIALQRIVDRIDEEFGLYTKFMETARLKADHIAKGGTECWPLVDVIPQEIETEKEFAADLADAMDPQYAFWRRDSRSGPTKGSGEFPNVLLYNHVLQESDFFYVPHAPLGVIEFANLPDRKHSIAAYELAVKEILEQWRCTNPGLGNSILAHESSISDDWDPSRLAPVGQLKFNDGVSQGQYFAWLIIYPTYDGSRLMPMLYIGYEEGGPYILPLDARNLEIFRDAIWFNETEHMSVFERIKELLGYRPNTHRVIEDAFRCTAPWLEHNPLFKIKQQHVDDLQMLDAFCQQQWEKK